MAYKTSFSTKGLWTPSFQTTYPVQGMTGFTVTPSYSPTASRDTNIFGERWVLSFWFKIEGKLRYVNDYTSYQGVPISYSQRLVCRIAGGHIYDRSGIVAGTNWVNSDLNIQFLSADPNNTSNILITYQPTFQAGKITESIGPFDENKWYNLTIAYNVTYQNQNNRFVTRIADQFGNFTVKSKAVVYGTSSSSKGYRTLAVDQVQWGQLIQTLPGDNGVDYQDIITRPNFGNNITAHWDRIFLDTYSLSDNIVFENFFNSPNNAQNLVVPTTSFAPLMGSAFGDVYPLNNNPPAYYLFKEGADFVDNTNLQGADLTVTNNNGTVVFTEEPRTGSIFGSSSVSSTFACQSTFTRLRSISASLLARTTMIPASGSTILGQASLQSDFDDQAEYIDSSYFDGEYIGTGWDADVLFGGAAKLESQFTLDANASIIQGAESSMEMVNIAFAVPGIVFDTEAESESAFDSEIIAGYVQSIDLALESLTTAEFSSGILIASNSASFTANVQDNILGSMIYDIGIQYALDWVDVDDDYVQPYYYLGLDADFDLYGLPIVVKQMQASVSAEFNLEAVTGFLKQIDSEISASTSVDNITGVIIGSTSFQTESVFSSLMSGGRVYNIDDTLAFDFTANFQGRRLVQTTFEPMEVDTAVNSVIDLFSGAQSYLSIETALLGTGGYFLGLPIQAFSSNFVLPPVLSRIINVDEYYIELVLPETRLLFIPIEPRTVPAQSETRQIRIHEEPTTMTVNEETRIIKPEVGESYLVGQRTRRVAA